MNLYFCRQTLKLWSVTCCLLTPLVASIVLSGCATQYPLSRNKTTSFDTRHVYDKNYKVNQSRKVNVGEAVIAAKDYYLHRISLPYVTPTEDFSASAGLITLNFNRGERYAVAGDVVMEGRKYAVVPGSTTVLGLMACILVQDDNTISLTNTGVMKPGESVATLRSGGELKVVPATVKMIRGFEEEVSKSKGYVNYEVLFNGVDKNTINMTYREFTPEGVARVAFYNNLTYDASAKTIRYKDYKIAIHDVDSESLTYTVLEEPAQ